MPGQLATTRLHLRSAHENQKRKVLDPRASRSDRTENWMEVWLEIGRLARVLEPLLMTTKSGPRMPQAAYHEARWITASMGANSFSLSKSGSAERCEGIQAIHATTKATFLRAGGVPRVVARADLLLQ